MATTSPRNMGPVSRAVVFDRGELPLLDGKSRLEPFAPAGAGAAAGRVRAEGAREPRRASVGGDQRDGGRGDHVDVDLQLVVDHVPGRRGYIVGAETRLEQHVLHRARLV